MLETFDAVFLNFFTKISHNFQRLTGRTNFFLAKCSVVVCALSALIAIANYYLPGLLYRNNTCLVGVLFYLVLLGLLALLYTSACDRREDAVLEDTKERNQSTLGDFGSSFRVLMAIPVLFDAFISWLIASDSANGILVFNILDFLFFPSYWCFMYFWEVNPLPPSKSKIREWAENIAAAFKKILPTKTSQ